MLIISITFSLFGIIFERFGLFIGLLAWSISPILFIIAVIGLLVCHIKNNKNNK